MMDLGLLESLVLLVVCALPLLILAAAAALLVWLVRRSSGATRKCPYCAETIKSDAVVCRFCGRDLVLAPPDAQ